MFCTPVSVLDAPLGKRKGLLHPFDALRRRLTVTLADKFSPESNLGAKQFQAPVIGCFPIGRHTQFSF
jgi:hypothetical protein